MLAGLQALNLTNESLELLVKYEENIIRKVFKQRDLASTTPLYFFWNVEPVEITMHKMIFSLFYGIWRDTTSPTCKISKKSHGEQKPHRAVLDTHSILSM